MHLVELGEIEGLENSVHLIILSPLNVVRKHEFDFVGRKLTRPAKAQQIVVVPLTVWVKVSLDHPGAYFFQNEFLPGAQIVHESFILRLLRSSLTEECRPHLTS